MPSFSLSSPEITHQFLDGEVVIVDFISGNYHSLRGAAAPAFSALVEGMPSEQLGSLFTAPPSDGAEQLDGLITRWVEAGLVVANPTGAASVPFVAPAPVAWVEPSFETFADMQQLLLADPIHDVGEGAWPRQVEPPVQ